MCKKEILMKLQVFWYQNAMTPKICKFIHRNLFSFLFLTHSHPECGGMRRVYVWVYGVVLVLAIGKWMFFSFLNILLYDFLPIYFASRFIWVYWCELWNADVYLYIGSFCHSSSYFLLFHSAIFLCVFDLSSFNAKTRLFEIYPRFCQ